MKFYTTLFIALVVANTNNGRLTNVSAAVASDSVDGGSQPHLRALTDLSSQNATDTNATDTNSTAPLCIVDSTNKRAGATCNSDSDCLSGMCVPGATSQECSRCCGQHPGGACNAAGEGCNAQYGGSCDLTKPFPMGEEVIHGCYSCVHNDEDEMDVDTPSLRASILKEE
mmetsp:Transcript_1251/g.1913  ORF Transcript_1251/g.1913 Transcript_1251/m.1913 type:complete len:170 (-) Transcript_1251:185-694(-)